MSRILFEYLTKILRIVAKAKLLRQLENLYVACFFYFFNRLLHSQLDDIVREFLARFLLEQLA
ncbi:hypothetical protein D3C79_1086960 [compost metagenome]